LRGPHRDAIEDNLPKGFEIGTLTIDAGPRRPDDRLVGLPLLDLQYHPRQKLKNAFKGGRPLRQAVDVQRPAQCLPVDCRLLAACLTKEGCVRRGVKYAVPASIIAGQHP
jgi:hypothetical protein